MVQVKHTLKVGAWQRIEDELICVLANLIILSDMKQDTLGEVEYDQHHTEKKRSDYPPSVQVISTHFELSFPVRLGREEILSAIHSFQWDQANDVQRCSAKADTSQFRRVTKPSSVYDVDHVNQREKEALDHSWS